MEKKKSLQLLFYNHVSIKQFTFLLFPFKMFLSYALKMYKCNEQVAKRQGLKIAKLSSTISKV
jgi:nitrate reductase gamma subunit